MAVRTDVATGIECLHYAVHDDFSYTANKKHCVARTRMMVSKISYKQNMGHFGKSLVVMCVHGHCRTMKREKPAKLDEFWDRLAAVIIKYDVKILTGDFNMSLTQVPIELKKRNVFVTCAAWTPWYMKNGADIIEIACKSAHIGIDSCGTFMVDQQRNMKVTV